ncbi:hypothetical protein HDU76_012080, partial [Blyttiomyces sp. JEL0837]
MFGKLLFWQGLVKRLKESGSSDVAVMTHELRLYYLYDMLFALAGKMMIMRAPNFPTFILSLLGSAAFRIFMRFISAVLTLRRLAPVNKVFPADIVSTENQIIIATAPVEPIQDVDDANLPIIDCDGNQELTNDPEQIRKSRVSIAITLADETNEVTVLHRQSIISTKQQPRLSRQESNASSSRFAQIPKEVPTIMMSDNRERLRLKLDSQ